jgi:hypothetical protein
VVFFLLLIKNGICFFNFLIFKRRLRILPKIENPNSYNVYLCLQSSENHLLRPVIIKTIVSLKRFGGDLKMKKQSCTMVAGFDSTNTTRLFENFDILINSINKNEFIQEDKLKFSLKMEKIGEVS